jgi:hypothetical protein
VRFVSSVFDVLKDLWGTRKEEGATQGGAGERNIFFMWQMASFYVRVMSSSCLSVRVEGDEKLLQGKELSKSH